MDSDYPGLPLVSASSIRLLKILESDREEDPVECTLATVDLDSQPSFHALSYTWGTALHSFEEDSSGALPKDSVYEIFVNGRPFVVTENLFDALWELRRSYVTDSLWIDAICIAQKNTAERNQQVSMMGRIYRLAEEVIIWLGKDKTHIEDIKWAISDLLPMVKQQPEKYIKPGLLWDNNRMAKDDATAMEVRVVGAMRFMSRRRWFSRAWIVQEVALSRSVRVLCGYSVLSWEGLTNFNTTLRTTDWGKALPRKFENESQRKAYWTARNGLGSLHHVKTLLGAYMLQSEHHRSRPPQRGVWHPSVAYGGETELEQAAAWLAYLLCILRVQDCELKHDKIYSALGLAACFSNLVGSLVRPDYSQTASIVYETTAAELILQNRFLSVLSHAKDLQIQAAAGLPSWAADYSSNDGCAPLLHHGIGTDFDASAARNSKRFPRSIQNSKLSLFGTPFDEVSHALATPMQDIVGSKVDLEEFVTFGGLLPLQYFNGQDPIDVLWRTIVFDNGPPDDNGKRLSPAPQAHRQAFTAWWIWQCFFWLRLHKNKENVWASAPTIHFLCRLFDPEKTITLPVNDLKKAISQLLYSQTRLKDVPNEFDKYYQELLPFTVACYNKIEERRLFKTKRDFVGMGSLSVLPGDQVWLIRDSLVPLVLRPVKDTDTFLLVGEAYLHGFMYGEMLDLRWGMEEKMRTVVIV